MTPTHRLRSAATLLAALALIVGSSPGTAHADWTDAGTTAALSVFSATAESIDSDGHDAQRAGSAIRPSVVTRLASHAAKG